MAVIASNFQLRGADHRKPALRTRACAFFGAVLALHPLCGRASDTVLSVLPKANHPDAYTLSVDTEDPRGPLHTDGRFTLIRNAQGTIDLAIDAPIPSRSNAALTKAGGQLFDASQSGPAGGASAAGAHGANPPTIREMTVAALNFAYAPTRETPATLHEGQTWDGSVAVTLPGGARVAIPLTFVVKSESGSDVAVTEDGSADGTAVGPHGTLKGRVTIDVLDNFHDGKLVKSAGSRTFIGHVFFRQISVSEKWALSNT